MDGAVVGDPHVVQPVVGVQEVDDCAESASGTDTRIVSTRHIVPHGAPRAAATPWRGADATAG
jgi:hypothetical protein